jgi:hypothetical protein
VWRLRSTYLVSGRGSRRRSRWRSISSWPTGATPATVVVASLGAGATLRDSGDDIRQMLKEQGVTPPPPPAGEDAAYTTALWAVSFVGLSVGEFSAVFYNHLPARQDQNEAQRNLVVLLHNWETESDPEARRPINDAIRATAAKAAGRGPAYQRCRYRPARQGPEVEQSGARCAQHGFLRRTRNQEGTTAPKPSRSTVPERRLRPRQRIFMHGALAGPTHFLCRGDGCPTCWC